MFRKLVLGQLIKPLICFLTSIFEITKGSIHKKVLSEIIKDDQLFST